MSGPAIYTVRNGLPTLVISPRTDAVTVYNQSPISVYLSSEPGNAGFELPPGSTLTWDAGQYLYAFHKGTPGDIADITVLANAGVMNDTRALARAIVAEGLAPAIATEINALGVPSIDKPKTLCYETLKPVPSTTLVLVPRRDVSNYSSVYGKVVLTNLFSQITLEGDGTFSINVKQWANNIEVSDRRYVMEAGKAKLQFPILGTELSVSVKSPSNAINQIRYEAAFTGTLRSLDEKIACDHETWLLPTETKASVILAGQTYRFTTVAANGFQYWYPSWASGQYDFTWGFYGSFEAGKNTKGVSVVVGPEKVSGAHAGMAIVGDPDYTSTTRNAMRRFSGTSSWSRPVVTLLNRNPEPITLSLSFSYEV